MSFQYVRTIQSPEEIREAYPVPSDRLREFRQRIQDIIDVLTRRSEKFLIIIGPCSAHNEDAVLEYVNRLAKLQDEVKEKLVLVPRIYTNKPRTTGEGYKGMAHQPDPEQDPDIAGGIVAIRKMHIRSFLETSLVAADEMLYPENYPYLEDILGYVAVGARSVENQLHRLTASGLDVPVGMKNPTSGDLDVMLNSVYAAQLPHDFIYSRKAVHTSGNPYAHCVLRGAIDHHGHCIPNYHYEDLMTLVERYQKRPYKNPAIIVDTNHANSGKRFSEQPRIAHEVMQNRKHSPILRDFVRGLMIESYLVEGCAPVGRAKFGQSITDPCLSWNDSAQLVRELAAEV
ncbi:MAG: 3-deoxy-7-phosphoheptulonate synthase [Candidatus Sumerlaeia bacterium]